MSTEGTGSLPFSLEIPVHERARPDPEDVSEPQKASPVSTANLDAMSFYFGRGQCFIQYSRLALNSLPSHLTSPALGFTGRC